MGLLTSLKTAKRSLTRRKTKNLSAILAISLGVTLMVGIQITTDTLESAFLTSLLLGEGEVDITVTNTTGNYLSAADRENITAMVPDAIGIMTELKTTKPAMVGSQFEPKAEMAGIQLDFPEEFGSFIDWETEEVMNVTDYLKSNTSVLVSSHLAEDLGLEKGTVFPVMLNTEFYNITVTVTINMTSGQPIINTNQSIIRTEISIEGVYDSYRPGIGSRYRGLVFSLEGFQDWMSLQDPSKKTDIISTYLITLKTDHFQVEIDEEYLQEQLDTLVESIPERTEDGKTFSVYTASSARLEYFTIMKMIFNMMSTMLTTLGLLIIITGILLITNVQLMSVEDREFQTGVMRAVGENRSGIFQTMLIETLFQGIVGGIFGLLGGFLFGQAVAVYLASTFGTGRASVQPVVNQEVMVLSVVIGVLIGIITGLLPAVRASRVNIVSALRGIKIAFEEKSSRNFAFLGIILSIAGCLFLLNNGLFNEDLQYIWNQEGWNSLDEWENILLGAGFLFTGMGIILSKYIDRTKAFNLTAIVLWASPTFLYVVAMGEGWISDLSGMSMNVMIVSIVEIVIGSVLIVGINLPILMRFLRSFLIRIKGLKGVAQVAPALISSHKTRSTLTFAIFAVVLTLNVTVASLVATNTEGTIGKSEEDSRGVDLYVVLSKPEVVLSGTSYTEELYQLDPRITDVIGLKTYQSGGDYTKFVALKEPFSTDYDPQTDLLPLNLGEFTSEQIRGDAQNSSDSDWRYDYYLSGLPDGVREDFNIDMVDDEILNLTRKAWDLFFDPTYEMPAYNVSFALSDGEIDIESMGSGSGFGAGDALDGIDEIKDENGSIITNPIVFTDSFILPLGMQIWVPMNTSQFGYPVYQPFTIGGSFDFQRAGGFPLSAGMDSLSSGDSFSGGGMLGTIYMPGRFSKYTNFLGEANGVTPFSRAEDQYDSFFIKTDLAFDDPEVDMIARVVEEFTNSEDAGYRELIDDNFIVATATSLYSKLESSMAMMKQMTSFLEIYVNFGLVIGAVGMAVISVRNVAERKREIGMMRAIGFPRIQVMFAALLELVVLGMIGLVIGVIDGLIVNIGFANLQNMTLAIPWGTIGAYVSFITFVALLAGAIPGWAASRIPPAEALRYVG